MEYPGNTQGLYPLDTPSKQVRDILIGPCQNINYKRGDPLPGEAYATISA
jgi:hypothetical protein